MVLMRTDTSLSPALHQTILAKVNIHNCFCNLVTFSTKQDNQLLGAFLTEKLQKPLKCFLDAYKNGPLMSKLKFS